jgi:hypothetical protein
LRRGQRTVVAEGAHPNPIKEALDRRSSVCDRRWGLSPDRERERDGEGETRHLRAL